MKNKLKPTRQTILRLIEREDGQAMTEYAVIAMGMIVSFLVINSAIMPVITAYYEFVAKMLSFPFP